MTENDMSMAAHGGMAYMGTVYMRIDPSDIADKPGAAIVDPEIAVAIDRIVEQRAIVAAVIAEAVTQASPKVSFWSRLWIVLNTDIRVLWRNWRANGLRRQG